MTFPLPLLTLADLDWLSNDALAAIRNDETYGCDPIRFAADDELTGRYNEAQRGFLWEDFEASRFQTAGDRAGLSLYMRDRTRQMFDASVRALQAAA